MRNQKRLIKQRRSSVTQSGERIFYLFFICIQGEIFENHNQTCSPYNSKSICVPVHTQCRGGLVICSADKNTPSNHIPPRNMLSPHSSSSMTFLSLRSGPLWNFTRMGDNVKTKLVRSQTLILNLTYFLEEIHSRSPWNH